MVSGDLTVPRSRRFLVHKYASYVVVVEENLEHRSFVRLFGIRILGARDGVRIRIHRTTRQKYRRTKRGLNVAILMPHASF
jgi:hypothetical protein